MATPQEKLASSLEALKQIQDKSGMIVRSDDLSRTHRERLVENGFLHEVMRGWYIATSPSDRPGDTTPWYASYWDFAARYLTDRFGDDWCLGPEASLSLHAGSWAVPQQLLVRAPRGSNKPIALPHNTSIYDMRVDLPDAADMQVENGVRFYTVPAALIAAAPAIFEQQPLNLRVVLAGQQNASAILAKLLEGGHSVIAGRLAGAFRNIGRDRIADDILKTMTSAGYTVRETDPFQARLALDLPKRELSPAATRIRLMWHKLREGIIDAFPKAPGLPNDADSYLSRIDDAFVTDAYHSLSIEGYRVSPELIERVRSGDWNPDAIAKDREQQDALAARGYWQAFQEVKKSVGAVLGNENPGEVADNDHGTWYRELFGASVAAGIIKAADLAGYRNDRVFIRNSMHTPLAPRAVPDAMTVFFELLTDETHPAVRVVLGHFVFVYIHPYMDGNGRMGRFLMNLMLAAGGYPWTVVPVERRRDYMAALEQASVQEDIVPFAQFLGELVEQGLKGAPLPSVPAKEVEEL
tara:strand:+ start:12760 stop:14331 length:1572 start_codon:yes stop_codon:yes gene_type:complete